MDLPANLNLPSVGALTVADRISDPMMPELDPSLLDFRPMDIDFGASKKDDPLNWNSQVLSDPLSIEVGRHEPPRDERGDFYEDDMHIDLDLPEFGLDDGPTLETGRKAPPPPDVDDILGEDDKFPNDLGYDEHTRTRLSSRVPSLIEDVDDQMPENGPMLLDDDDDDDDDTFALPALPVGNGMQAPVTAHDSRLQRESQSPLSSARSSLVREFDATNFNVEEEEAPLRRAAHTAKKRKIIQADADTMMSSAQIKQQQADRSAILKPASLLSRDPILLNLMNMQKNGEFVSNVMGDGRAQGWAPELRGILSIEVVRKSGELKRKRDSGVADVGEEEDRETMPALEIPEDEISGPADEGLGLGADATAGAQSPMVDLPVDDGFVSNLNDGIDSAAQEDDADDYDAARNNFDETTVPLLHPSEQGAISQGTKHAVHLLRECFGSSEDSNQSQQKKANILFQGLLPEATTSKAQATKMFFEVLVLATKDAVKVEQANEELGSSLRIRAKRGLFGSWAEEKAGGEIAEETVSPIAASS